MKLYKKYCLPDNITKIYKFCGIKVWTGVNKQSIKRQLSELKNEVELLHYLLNMSVDITKVPQAKGPQRLLQQEHLKLLSKVADICTQHGLIYWIDFGTLLGAIRQNAFIPWDDDVDITMPRKDYIRILDILKTEFRNSDFEVREKDFTNHFQIRIKNADNTIGLDIFPVDECVCTKEEKNLLNAEVKRGQNLLLQSIMDCSDTDYKKSISEITTDITKPYNGEIPNMLFYGIDYPHLHDNLVIEYEDVFPLSEIEFEGLVLPCPRNAKKHLENLYGNYLKFPRALPNIIIV